MKTLSRSAIAAGAIIAPHAAPGPRPIRILQIGDGVFLRGFVDWMVDVANGKGVLDAGVAILLARPRREPPALPLQDNLFTVLLRGRSGGGDVEDRRMVGAVETTLDPHRQWPETLRIAAGGGLAFRRLQHDRSRNRGRRRNLRSRGLPAELSRESGGSPQGALRRARRRRGAGPRLSSLRADRGKRRDASAHCSRLMPSDGVSGPLSRPGSKGATFSSTRSSTGSCPDFPPPKRRRCSPDGATAILWRLRRSPFISG